MSTATLKSRLKKLEEKRAEKDSLSKIRIVFAETESDYEEIKLGKNEELYIFCSASPEDEFSEPDDQDEDWETAMEPFSNQYEDFRSTASYETETEKRIKRKRPNPKRETTPEVMDDDDEGALETPKREFFAIGVRPEAGWKTKPTERRRKRRKRC